MKNKKIYKLIILGSGPAGYTASIYASRANLNPILITGYNKGGQLINSTNIENWPTETKNINGPKLMNKFLKKAIKSNVNIIFDHIHKAKLNKKPICLTGEYNTYKCHSLIIATGSSAKYLNLKSEKKYIGKGLSTCATCDGFFYKNKNIAIIGGGNTAIEEALYLSNIAKKVTIIHRRSKFTAEYALTSQIPKKNNIEIKWNNILIDIQGNSFVEYAIIKNIKTNNTQKIKIHGLFLAIGNKPNTKIFENQLILKNGYIITNNKLNTYKTETNIPGIFAAGDVQDFIYKQAITSAGTGCMAAIDAQKYLEKIDIKNK